MGTRLILSLHDLTAYTQVQGPHMVELLSMLPVNLGTKTLSSTWLRRASVMLVSACASQCVLLIVYMQYVCGAKYVLT